MYRFRFLIIVSVCVCGVTFVAGAAMQKKMAVKPKRAILPKDTLPEVLDAEHIPAGLTNRRPVIKESPLTVPRMKLGRRLFFDGVLSGNGKVSCASCHRPDHGFASPNPLAVGIHGQVGKRNAPSLLNRAYGKSFFWDGRAASLEEQALQPIASKTELGSSLKDVVARLRADASYVEQFYTAFGEQQKPLETVTAKNLAKALGSFQRVLLLGDSAIDRFRGGDAKALTDAERQGLWLFESKSGCWKCHSGNDFTDEQFHNTGVSWGKKPADLGRFFATGKVEDVGKFKTPTLRGVSLTAPYMHDGSQKTLKDVVEFYNRGGIPNLNRDHKMQSLHLTIQEVAQLVAFLEALSRTADSKGVLRRKVKKGTRKNAG